MTQSRNNTFPPTEPFAIIVSRFVVPRPHCTMNPTPSLRNYQPNNQACTRLHRQQRNKISITPLEPKSCTPPMRPPNSTRQYNDLRLNTILPTTTKTHQPFNKTLQ